MRIGVRVLPGGWEKQCRRRSAHFLCFQVLGEFDEVEDVVDVVDLPIELQLVLAWVTRDLLDLREREGHVSLEIHLQLNLAKELTHQLQVLVLHHFQFQCLLLVKRSYFPST